MRNVATAVWNRVGLTEGTTAASWGLATILLAPYLLFEYPLFAQTYRLCSAAFELLESQTVCPLLSFEPGVLRRGRSDRLATALPDRPSACVRSQLRHRARTASNGCRCLPEARRLGAGSRASR